MYQRNVNEVRQTVIGFLRNSIDCDLPPTVARLVEWTDGLWSTLLCERMMERFGDVDISE